MEAVTRTAHDGWGGKVITIKAVTLTSGEVFVPVITGKDLTTGQNIISWCKVSE